MGYFGIWDGHHSQSMFDSNDFHELFGYKLEKIDSGFSVFSNSAQRRIKILYSCEK